jgi:PKD repeat protein
MYHLRVAFIFQLLIVYSFGLQAQALGKQLLVKPFQNKVFIKELGQFSRNAKELKIPFTEPVFYGVENAEFNAYFTAHGIIFQFPERKNIEEKDKEKLKGEQEEKTTETIWHTAQMQWINANASVELVSEQKVSEYYNYGAGANDSTINFVPAFKKIKYVNLYPGVDAEFELSEEGGLKYKFLVKPNVIVPAISFQWIGINKIDSDEKGDLHIKSKFDITAINDAWQVIDHSPNAFTSSSHTIIPIKYNVDDNKVEFKFSSENISSNEGIVIDPWITNTSFPSVNKAFDIQEDSIGNVFVIGNNTNWDVQKYNSGGVLQWTYVTYAILMGDIAVDKPGNVYIVGGYSAGKRQKLDTAGVQLWVFSGLAEEWRLAFNYSKTILSEGGYFSGNKNLAKLDMNTGAISNEIAYGAETRGLATDCNGDIYSLHVTFGYSGVAASNVLRKTYANFTPASSVGSGFLLAEAQPAATAYGLNPAYGGGSNTYQVLNAIVVNGPYVFIYDGATIRRINKTSLTIINSVSVPNGTVTMCGGIVADLCGNIYAGGTNGIAKFDSSLTYISTIPTPAAVYDIILGNNGELIACGEGFLGSFSTICTTPPALTATVTSTNASCKTGSASITAIGGTAPYSYLWQPGGQTTSNVTNLAAGTYTFTVTDPFCHSYQDTVTVHQTPSLTLTPGLINVISPGVVSNESCPNSLNGSATVSASGGIGPYSFSWNTNPVQNTQTAVGLSAGTYIATVTDADTCKDTVSIVITRKPNPIATFTSTNVCNGNATQFRDSSTTASGTINTWHWDFGDGSSLNSNQNPPYTYPNAGNYIATLIVNNNFGCADTITKPVQVYYNPTAGFTHNDVCFGDSMFFTNISSVDPSTSIASYLWAFGDGSTTSNLKSPAHFYSNKGIYSVTLVTTTIDGCTDATTISVKTFDAPHAAFTFNNTCLANSVLFTNSTTPPTMGNTANWSWNFGDGAPLNTTVLSPQHLYNIPGNYQVTLITHSSNLG